MTTATIQPATIRPFQGSIITCSEEWQRIQLRRDYRVLRLTGVPTYVAKGILARGLIIGASIVGQCCAKSA